MNQNSKITISQNVCKLRKQKKLTREKLSLLLNFENSYISKLEKQKINITIERLDIIANFFEIKTFELLISRD
ncbi:MAG: helix-turn-helix transcriptional regulator [Cyanobacteria bacterium SIG27]|nr:helix-turn-helix transcriptional regulator [Cyanobacteria bacterium SIG27]